MKTLLLAFILIITGATGVFAKAADIEGIQWTLTHAAGQQVTNSSAYFEIERDGGRFTGSTGCNRMFGSVHVRGQAIDFSGIGTTKRMCKLEPGSVTEPSFLNAMNRASGYSVNGNNLNVYDRSGRTILRFKRLVKLPPVVDPPARVGLGDRKWVLESIKNRQTFAPIKGAFVKFDTAKGSAGGDSGCNVFGGEYTVTGSRIAIGELVSTMRACIEDERMTIEREFLDGLRTSTRFEIKDGRLFLYRGQNLLLTLRGEKG